VNVGQGRYIREGGPTKVRTNNENLSHTFYESNTKHFNKHSPSSKRDPGQAYKGNVSLDAGQLLGDNFGGYGATHQHGDRMKQIIDAYKIPGPGYKMKSSGGRPQPAPQPLYDAAHHSFLGWQGHNTELNMTAAEDEILGVKEKKNRSQSTQYQSSGGTRKGQRSHEGVRQQTPTTKVRSEVQHMLENAKILIQAKKFEEAVVSLKQIVENDANCLDAQYLLGLCYFNFAQYKPAIEVSDRTAAVLRT
jgi:TolA-binding protein